MGNTGDEICIGLFIAKMNNPVATADKKATNGRDGLSEPSGEWVVNEDGHGRILKNHPMSFHSHGRLGETVPAGGRNGRDGLSEPSGEWVVNDETMEEF